MSKAKKDSILSFSGSDLKSLDREIRTNPEKFRSQEPPQSNVDTEIKTNIVDPSGDNYSMTNRVSSLEVISEEPEIKPLIITYLCFPIRYRTLIVMILSSLILRSAVVIVWGYINFLSTPLFLVPFVIINCVFIILPFISIMRLSCYNIVKSKLNRLIGAADFIILLLSMLVFFAFLDWKMLFSFVRGQDQDLTIYTRLFLQFLLFSPLGILFIYNDTFLFSQMFENNSVSVQSVQ